MEFMYFGDLQKYINYCFLPESEASLITLQVAQGLRFMHDSNFVHRDLKPLVQSSITVSFSLRRD